VNKPLLPFPHVIAGRGGPSGGSSPTRTPDTLRSKDHVEVVLGISEGDIYGLIGDSILEKGKNFYVGDTPLVSPDGNKNFGDFDLIEYVGDGINQTVQLTLGGAAISHDVGVKFEQDVPVIRQGTQTAAVIDVTSLPPSGVFTGAVYNVTTEGLAEGFWTWTGTDWRRVNDPYVHFLEVRLVISQLYEENDDGIFEYEIEFDVEYKRSDEGDDKYRAAYPSKTITVKGKTTSNYVKELRWGVAPSTVPYTIRITQRTDPKEQEDDGSKLAEMTWESFQEVNAESLILPDLAFIHITGQASDQFSQLPEFSGIYRGRIVRVPSNYNPTTRVYTGVWDGTFVRAYTNNPAWCLYDFVTHDRYGLSAFTPMELDKFDVYEAAKWCDVMVPDGQGGTHPRWTFNHLIAEARSGPEMARYIAGMFNAAFFDDGNGNAYLRVDKDDDATAIFGPENVVDGVFEYSFSDITSRYNQITVAFDNPILQWAQDRRQVHSPEHIAKFGVIPYDFIAIGCTNPQEALRRGQYKLLTSTTEVMSVTFQTNRVGGYVNPFDVILISDPDLGFGVTRRLKEIDESRTQVTLRDAFYLENGINYKAKFQIPNTAYPENDSNEFVVIERNLVGGTGYTNTITFTQPLPDNVPEYAMFSIEQQTGGIGLPKPFRVLKVEEVDGEPDNIRILAIELNRNKWYDVDNVTESGVPRYSSLQVSVSRTPSNFQVEVRGRTQQGEPRVDILLTWDRIASTILRSYDLHVSVNGGPLQLLQSSGATYAELLNVELGIYTFYLYSVNLNGDRSPPVSAVVDLRSGTISNPTGIQPVTNLRPTNGNWVGRDLHVEWDFPAPPIFFKHFKVEFKEVSTGDVLKTVLTTEQTASYLFSENEADHPIEPVRSVIAAVTVVASTDDGSGLDQISSTTAINAQNAPPGTPGGVLIQWNEEGMVIGFNDPTDLDLIGTMVWIDTDSGVWQSDDAPFMVSSANPIIVPGLSRDQSYYVHLAHYDNFGQTGLLYSNEIFVNNNIPSVPTGLSLVVAKTRVGNESSKTIVNATWDANSLIENVDHYVFALRPNNTSDFVEFIATVPLFTFTTYFDLYDNVYQGKVRAVNRAGISSAFSTVVEPSLEIEDTTPPEAPTGVTLDSGYGFMMLNWVNDVVSDLEFTEVYMADTNVQPAEPVAEVTGNSYFIPGVAAGETWYFWLRARDYSGNVSDVTAAVSGSSTALPTGDTVPGAPGQVANLSLSSTATVLNDGGIQTRLRAVFDLRPEADVSFYEWAIKETVGGNYSYGLTGTNAVEWVVKPNKTYYVKVRAVDAGLNKGVFSTEISHTTAGDAIAPGAPSGLTAVGGYNSIFLRWTNAVDTDIAGTEIWEAASNNVTFATKIATTGASTSFVREGLATNVTRYYWVRHIDTSGNVGAYNAAATSGVTGSTVPLGSTAISDGAIITQHMTAGSIAGDRITVNSLDANRISATSILAGTIKVGVTDTSLSTIYDMATLGATNPATRINSGVTLIDPGKILISGATTLANWRNGGDLTKIEGGSIAANSISANVVKIGLRGVDITGIEFEANKPTTNSIRWSAGTIIYIDDAGAVATANISSGNQAWTTDTTLYLYWTKGSTSISTTTTANTAYAADTIVLATYKGGVDMVVTYGRTIIDGSQITAQTITAGQLSTGELLTVSAQIKDAIITSAKILSLTADKITTGTIGAQTITVGDGKFQILGGTASGQQKIIVKDVGDVARVELGKIGDSGLDYGIIIRDPLGQTILSSTGVPAAAVQGLGTLATLNTVGVANIITGFGVNQLFNSAFRLSTYGWLVGANDTGQSPTLSRNLGVQYSLIGGSTAFVSLPNSIADGTSVYVENDHAGLRYPVIAGQKYEAYVYMVPVRSEAALGMRFYDVAGNPLTEYTAPLVVDINLDHPAKHKINPGIANNITTISVAEYSAASVTLRLEPAAGSFDATAISGVTVGGSGSNRTLTGRASLINNLIAEGKLTFTPVNTDDVAVEASVEYGVSDPQNTTVNFIMTVTGDHLDRVDLQPLANYEIAGLLQTAPANAVSVKPFVKLIGRGEHNPILFWTKAYFGEALPNQTETSQWTPGPDLDRITPSNISTYMAAAAISELYVADAAITNAKIANIDAGKITAGTINADRIAAESISTNKITIGGVTTDRIANAAVTNATSYFALTALDVEAGMDDPVLVASSTIASIGAVMNITMSLEVLTGLSPVDPKDPNSPYARWMDFELHRNGVMIKSFRLSNPAREYKHETIFFSEYAPVGSVTYDLYLVDANDQTTVGSMPGLSIRERFLQLMEFRR
jgi:predicted phage tail protein